jgi:hypothetical protein
MLKLISAVVLALSLLGCGKKVEHVVNSKPQFYEHKAENGLTCIVIVLDYTKEIHCK